MVSVIVPIFNVEGYLSRCLESIVSQTYSDLEIILVDDGSTDNSGSICDEYAGKDIRIKVIHQENRGLPEARNSGLRVAKGDYIIMPDGDDVLHPQMIENLYNLIISGDYDFSMCYGKKVFTEEELKSELQQSHALLSSVELNPDSCMKNLYMGGQYDEIQYHVVWNKLFKRELLENVYFSDTASQDTEFNNRVYQQIAKAICTKAIFYYWIQRPGSITHKGFNQRYVNVVHSYYVCLNSIPQDNGLFRAYCLRRFFRVMPSRIYWTKGGACHESAKKLCRDLKHRTSRELRKNHFIPFYEKCILYSFNYFPPIYVAFVKSLDFRTLIQKRRLQYSSLLRAS